MNNINDYIKTSEAAARLGVSRQAVNEMIRKGRYQAEKGLVYWSSVEAAQANPLKKSMQSLRAKKKKGRSPFFLSIFQVIVHHKISKNIKTRL